MTIYQFTDHCLDVKCTSEQIRKLSDQYEKIFSISQLYTFSVHVCLCTWKSKTHPYENFIW